MGRVKARPARGDMNRRAILQARPTVGERAYIPNYDPVLQALKNGEGSIDLNYYYEPKEGEQQVPLSHVVLGSPLRNFFISKVKAPLQKVLIMVAKRIPEITKQNTTYTNTHILIDIIEKFTRCNTVKPPMFDAAFKVLLLEIEHDKAYRDVFNWFIEEIIKSILRHEWQPPLEGSPEHRFWHGDEVETLRGGKYSIISILKDKKAMENLLGEKWRLE
uniref:Uncharacterized protein n=1 Tax=viral metagenome TaxID=1070528 RepID=A0A6M3JZS2_9ZZZZ